jgi:hypothetical protein
MPRHTIWFLVIFYTSEKFLCHFYAEWVIAGSQTGESVGAQSVDKSVDETGLSLRVPGSEQAGISADETGLSDSASLTLRGGKVQSLWSFDFLEQLCSTQKL